MSLRTNELQFARIGDVCISVADGDWIETKDQSDEGYRLLQIGNIGVGRFRESGKSRFVSEETFYRLNCTKIEIGDVLIARMPDPTGRAWCVDEEIPPSITSVDVAIARVDQSILDAKFLSYFFNSPLTLARIAGMQTGSTRQRIKRSDLVDLQVPLPTLNVQKSIARVLAVLDRKIELNILTAKTLEEIAQTIFKSWFIDFDPVKAKMAGEKPAGMDDATAALFPDSMVDSELGPIPRGWKLSQVGDEVECVGGSTPSTANSEFWDGDIFWTTPKDLSRQVGLVTTSSERRITSKGLQKISSGVLPVHSVLMSSRAPIGYLSINAVPTAVNQGFIAIRQSPRFAPLYLLFWLQMNMLEIKNRAGGGTFAEISRGAFKSIPFVVPNEQALLKYAEISTPILLQLTSLSLQNQELKNLRDSLLPRLISGELQIPEEMLGA
jgi:type I restriction enzyme S subunit